MLKNSLVKQVFGNIEGYTTEQIKTWESQNIITTSVQNLNGRIVLRCNKKIETVVKDALNEIIIWENKYQRILVNRDVNDYGGYFYRKKNKVINGEYIPQEELSLHSWGIAIDFNIGQSKSLTALENEGININNSMEDKWQPPALLRIMKAEGFEFGGDWKSWKDYMHFELSILKIKFLGGLIG
jgi:hypothetical protein